MKRVVALLALILGGLGTVLLSVGVVAVWHIERQVVDRSDRVTGRLADHTTKIESKLRRLEGRVTNITVDVNKIEAEAARLVERALTEALAQTEFKQVLDRLTGMLDQCEEVGETLHLVSRLFEDIADLSSQLDGKENVSEQLRNISAALDMAAKTLTEIRGELADLRQRKLIANPKKLTDLVAQTRGPLERLAGAIESIRLHAVEARDALELVRSRVRFWARSVAVLVCLVAAWYGWGQICLIGWGWARLSHASSAPSTE